ncbi:MAG TPA: hypothetical protein VMT00_11440 [Thermoanaerobaculia bacterium]|nr:hypothetical protein [Thermoanaerobaculia bacterium]
MRAFEKTPPEGEEVLRKPISQLGLKIEGSPVEEYIRRLYAEIEAKGLSHFRPAFYLTDQWGCPSEEPVIGVPFYLTDRRLGAIEQAINDIEDEGEIMMYMRHEAGHAFNYAYELYKTLEWHRLFGPFRRAYRDEYTPIPFSKRFVRHIAGWYAQKHPDEDFAETFAVWLTPRSNWRKKYAGWPALTKLLYVDRIAKEVAGREPVRPLGEIDFTVEEMEATVEQFYRENQPDETAAINELPLDTDLADIFNVEGPDANNFRPAAEVIARHRKSIVDKVTYWTGVRRSLVKVLIEAIEQRATEQSLQVERGKEERQLIELTAYATTLAMNYLTRGRFVNP